MSYNSEHPRHHVVVPSPGAKEPLYSDDNEPSESIFEPRHARSGPDSAHISLADRHPPCSHLHASLLAFAQSSVTGYSLSPHSVSDSEVRRPSTFTSRPVDLVPVCPGSTVTRRQAASDEEHCDISDDDLASKSGGNDCDLICQTHRNEDNQSREPGEEVYMDVDRDTDSVDEAIEETLWSRSSSPCPATQEQNATAADDTSGRSPANPESSVKTSCKGQRFRRPCKGRLPCVYAPQCPLTFLQLSDLHCHLHTFACPVLRDLACQTYGNEDVEFHQVKLSSESSANYGGSSNHSICLTVAQPGENTAVGATVGLSNQDPVSTSLATSADVPTPSTGRSSKARLSCVYAPQCPRTFSRMPCMHRHLETFACPVLKALKRTAVKAFICPRCGKNLSRLDALGRHMKKVSCEMESGKIGG